jgi:ABC-type multidrug transport system fused ATPase/permease subunit
LDPFEQHDDATLNAALRDAGLFSLQTETDEARLTLDSDISGGGNNLSVGQRQIIALARAMVRNSKLLILDEGTPSLSVVLARNNDSPFCSYIGNWYAFTLLNQI